MGRDHEPLVPSTIVGHRVEVVRRLIDRGLSPTTLTIVLPEWSDTIAGVSGASR